MNGLAAIVYRGPLSSYRIWNRQCESSTSRVAWLNCRVPTAIVCHRFFLLILSFSHALLRSSAGRFQVPGARWSVQGPRMGPGEWDNGPTMGLIGWRQRKEENMTRIGVWRS